MGKVLLCTAGTSLLTNINRADNKMDVEKELLEKGQFELIAKTMLKQYKASDRKCGAEINTINMLINNKKIDIDRIYFLISDTARGNTVGEILKHYYSSYNVEVIKIENLTDANPKHFKIKGLRNLVKEIADKIKKWSKDKIIIDATGGYKAQIAIAVLMGQSLGIPVYYKHELFNEIIDFPAMPISLDYSILSENYNLFDKLFSGETIDYNNIEDSKIEVFLNCIEENGEKICELSPIGMIYLEAYYVDTSSVNLRKVPEKDRKDPHFSDDHYPKGFKEFVKKVWKENDFILTCKSVDYSGQRGIKGTKFKLRENKIIGEYRNDFGARFEVFLSSDSGYKEKLKAVEKLNKRYTSK